MVSSSFKLMKDQLPYLINRYKNIFKNHLLYYIVMMNIENLKSFESNTKLIEEFESGILYVHKLINGMNTFLLGSPTIEKNKSYLVYVLDVDEQEILKQLIHIGKRK